MLILLVAAAHGQIYDWNADALPGVKIETVAFRGWIPEHAGPLAGTLVLIPGRHGDGRGMAVDVRWQELAKEIGFAIVACQFTNGDPGLYQTDTGGEVPECINKAVARLATDGVHPELAKAPLAFWGTSAGSNVSSCYCSKFPQRVIAFGSSKGTFGPGLAFPAATTEIPMFFALGAKDKPEWLEASQAGIRKGIAARAPWTLALHKTEGHDVGNSLNVIIPFFKASIKQRLTRSAPENSGSDIKSAASGFKTQLPSFSKPVDAANAVPETKLYKINQQNGWLGDPETYEVFAAKDYKGKKAAAVWLADEMTAKAWQAYLRSP